MVGEKQKKLKGIFKMNILLLIDMQYGFEAAGEILGYIENIDFSKYDKIIATQFVNNKDTFFYKNGYTEMVDIDENIELYPIVKEKATNIIMKDTYSLPLEELYKIVNKDQIENIDIIGVETDACILATLFTLWDAKIPFTLLKSRTAGKYGIYDATKLIISRNLNIELDDQTKIFHRIKKLGNF